MKFESGIAKAHELTTDGTDIESAKTELIELFSSEESALAVLELQSEKNQILEEMRRALAQLNEDGTVGEPGASRSVTYKGEDLIYFGKGGTEKTMTKGQLYTSMFWGFDHHLDASVPRDIKKRYIIERARNQISERHDRQIAASEMNQTYNQGGGLDEAYRAVYEQNDENMPDGIIAEKMVESFLRKIAADYKDMPFKIKSVNAYQDVEYKIDFIIEPVTSDKSVGFDIQDPTERHDIGIQFTTAKSSRTIEKKEKQIERSKKDMDRTGDAVVEDLVLVTLPISEVRDKFDAWNKASTNKKPAGGPEDLWDTAMEEQVFKQLLEHVLSKDAIEKAWDSTNKK